MLLLLWVDLGVAEIEKGIFESVHKATSSQLVSNPRSRSVRRHGRLTRSAAQVVLPLVPFMRG